MQTVNGIRDTIFGLKELGHLTGIRQVRLEAQDILRGSRGFRLNNVT